MNISELIIYSVLSGIIFGLIGYIVGSYFDKKYKIIIIKKKQDETK